MWLILTKLLNKWWLWAAGIVAAVLAYFRIRTALAERRATKADEAAREATAGRISAQRDAEALRKQREREAAANAARENGARAEHEIKGKSDAEVFDDLDHAFDDFDGRVRGK